MARKKGDYIGTGKDRKQWDGRRWVPRPVRTQTSRNAAPGTGRSRAQRARPAKSTPTKSRPTTRTPQQAMNLGADYRVMGITYDPKTGRPVDVPKNRQPVKAQDRTKTPPKSPPKAPPKSTPTKSKTSTYDAHGSKLHIGRHKTLKEHRAAVAKAKEEKNKNTSPKRKPRTWLADNYKPGKKK